MKYILIFLSSLMIGVPVGVGLYLTGFATGLLCAGINLALLVASNEID